jgi:hypothetical protein
MSTMPTTIPQAAWFFVYFVLLILSLLWW